MSHTVDDGSDAESDELGTGMRDVDANTGELGADDDGFPVDAEDAESEGYDAETEDENEDSNSEESKEPKPPPNREKLDAFRAYCRDLLTACKDTNLCHDLTTGRAVTGALHMVNQTPVDWFTKKQATVETATHGSEFTAARTTIQQITGLRLALRCLGVKIHGGTHMFGDNKSVAQSGFLPHLAPHKHWHGLSHHCTRDTIASGMVIFHHMPGGINTADVLSKHWGHIQAHVGTATTITVLEGRHCGGWTTASDESPDNDSSQYAQQANQQQQQQMNEQHQAQIQLFQPFQVQLEQPGLSLNNRFNLFNTFNTQQQQCCSTTSAHSLLPPGLGSATAAAPTPASCVGPTPANSNIPVFRRPFPCGTPNRIPNRISTSRQSKCRHHHPNNNSNNNSQPTKPSNNSNNINSKVLQQLQQQAQAQQQMTG